MYFTGSLLLSDPWKALQPLGRSDGRVLDIGRPDIS